MPIFSDIGPWAAVPEELLYECTAYAVHLWCVLHRHADRTDVCHPSRRRLAALMRCSDDTVDKAKRELIAKGWLTVHVRKTGDGQNETNVYVLHFVKRPATSGTDNSVGGAANTGHRGAAITGTEREPNYNDKKPSSSPLATEQKKVTKREFNYTPEFERFYGFYLRKTHKGDAFKVWQKMTKAEQDAATDRAEWIEGCYKANDPQGQRIQFIRHPGRWLRNRGWEDAQESVEMEARGR